MGPSLVFKQNRFMTEELVTFETAVLSKDKGFDEECRHFFLKPPDVEAIDDEEMGKWRHGNQLLDIFEEVKQRGQCRNSNMNSEFFARPTQDLLHRWLREHLNAIVWVRKIPYMSEYCGAVTLGEQSPLIAAYGCASYEVGME